MTQKLLARDTDCVLVIPVINQLGEVSYLSDQGLTPFNAPTSTLLNFWQTVINEAAAHAGGGGNITAAVKDDINLVATASDTDSDRALNASGNSTIATTRKFNATANAFFDANLTDTSSNFNLAKSLFRAPDVEYAFVRRIGSSWTAPFAVGDEVWSFYAATDNPVIAIPDAGNITIGVTTIPKNKILGPYNLAA